MTNFSNCGKMIASSKGQIKIKEKFMWEEMSYNTYEKVFTTLGERLAYERYDNIDEVEYKGEDVYADCFVE